MMQSVRAALRCAALGHAAQHVLPRPPPSDCNLHVPRDNPGSLPLLCFGLSWPARWESLALTPLPSPPAIPALQVFGALHFGMPWPNDDVLHALLDEDPASPFTDWHTYELEWEKEAMRW